MSLLNHTDAPSIERARERANEGATLALHYNTAKHKDATMQLCNELRKAHPGIRFSIHGRDLGTCNAIDKLFSEIRAEHRKIDIVVNTAGMVLKKPIANVSEAEYDKMFAYAVFVDDQRRRTVDQFPCGVTSGATFFVLTG